MSFDDSETGANAFIELWAGFKIIEFEKSKNRRYIRLRNGAWALLTSFINFYFEFEYRKHRTTKRDVKLLSGDAIVSRKETLKQYLDTMHARALNQKSSVEVGSSDPHRKCCVWSDKGSSASWKCMGRKFQPSFSEVLCSFRQTPLGCLKMN